MCGLSPQDPLIVVAIGLAAGRGVVIAKSLGHGQ
jgi:phosphoribosylamine-glycine ligase